jgi:hypothetical protein
VDFLRPSSTEPKDPREIGLMMSKS